MKIRTRSHCGDLNKECPRRFRDLNLGPQLVVLCGEVVKPLGAGALLARRTTVEVSLESV